MNNLDWSYLAGVIDSDGTITISITQTRTKNPSVIASFQVRFGWKDSYQKHVYDIHEKLNSGKVYFSNKGKPEGMCFLQSTNISDAIFMAKGILPYLRVKKDRCEKFLECAYFWRDSMKKTNGIRKLGERLRSKSDIVRVVKTAQELNYDRQTVRYRDKKGWEYWEPIINKLYS